MILFIDTHDSLITIGLKIDDKLFIKNKESEYTHSVYVMPMIEEIFKENNVKVNDLKKIIVINGPGSFTGIRIGLSIAKTMAYALKIDINTISSLTAYLISSDYNGDKMCIIEDNKGSYLSVFDSKNKSILDECYMLNNPYKYHVVDNKLDISKIIDYCSTLKSENPHFIKANYIKKISTEVSDDK